MNDDKEIKKLAKLINENVDDYSDEYEGLDDEDEFYGNEDNEHDYENEPALMDRLVFQNGDSIGYYQVGSDDTLIKLVLNGLEYCLDENDENDEEINKLLLIHKDEIVQRLIDCRYGHDFIKSVADGESRLVDVISDMF